jgi:hypothetical protein
MATMASITPKIVREIMKTGLSDADLEGSIATAQVLYRNRLGAKDVPVDLQFEIKRYLSAHFASINDPSTSILEEKIGDASVKYAGTTVPKNSTSDLNSTKWGQAAIVLDPTGILKKLGSSVLNMWAL